MHNNNTITTIIPCNVYNINLPALKKHKTYISENTFQKIIFSDICKTPPSLMPFKIIKHMASNCLNSFISKAVIIIKNEDPQKDINGTSCIKTVVALSIIFFGEAKAKKAINHLCLNNEISLSAQLPTQKWEYIVKNLFDGILITEINKDETYDLLDKNEKNQKNFKNAKPQINKFFKYTQQIVDKAEKLPEDQAISFLNESFKDLKFNFNISTIDAFMFEIEQNNQKVNPNKSFIYCIGIIAPEYEYKNEHNFSHSFIIEQFYAVQNVRYRLYQSWINEATLLDEFLKRQYGDLGEGSWSENEFNQFFNDLMALYTHPLIGKQPQISYEKCFGFKGTRSPLNEFIDGKLIGQSFRYYSSEIDPADCLKNFTSFVETHGII